MKTIISIPSYEISPYDFMEYTIDLTIPAKRAKPGDLFLTISNEHGGDQTSTVLNIMEKLSEDQVPFLDPLPRDVTTLPGGDVLLETDVQGSEPLSVSQFILLREGPLTVYSLFLGKKVGVAGDEVIAVPTFRSNPDLIPHTYTLFQVEWFVRKPDGTRSAITPSAKHTVHTNGSLEITGVEEEDVGEYEVLVSNSAGTATGSADVALSQQAGQ